MPEDRESLIRSGLNKWNRQYVESQWSKATGTVSDLTLHWSTPTWTDTWTDAEYPKFQQSPTREQEDNDMDGWLVYDWAVVVLPTEQEAENGALPEVLTSGGPMAFRDRDHAEKVAIHRASITGEDELDRVRVLLNVYSERQ